MVAMLYQKIAIEHPGVSIECYTALSGEQAVRMCRTHRFHVITMDQQMSNEYCQSLKYEVEKEDPPDEVVPRYVTFGSDKIANAKARQAYFKNDKWIHDIQPGDGSQPGHEAIKQIRREMIEEKRPPTLCFNLTGNLLETDRVMFLSAGSSGMLPKPTKLEDMLNLLQSNMGLYVSQGLLQLSGEQVVMDGGALQIGVRFAKEEEVVEVDKGKVAGPWAGGATKRAAATGTGLPATTTPATAAAATAASAATTAATAATTAAQAATPTSAASAAQ
jgi:CheY-like chemotaxis protein